ncbi:SRPBCC domain-containing protein [Streptomyces sp. NPDC003077]|uniref:SRPBCC domain-containing protein n=1 Tax=Streptomyces sp. NPDC003077 TaxID=3154443 RepID=UPI0033B697A7
MEGASTLPSPIPYGTAVSHGDTHILTFQPAFPQPVEDVWQAVATPEGLPTWLAAADPFEQHEGGAITLRWLNTDEQGESTVAPGQVTAWGPNRLAEYTVDLHGRVRFDLSPAPDAPGTRLHFTNEFTGPTRERLSRLAGWHHHFEYLVDALAGRPADWSTWNLDRWRTLYGAYERGARGA